MSAPSARDGEICHTGPAGRKRIGPFRGSECAVRQVPIFHIPKATRHGFRGEPGHPVLALQSYTPAGEEQRFLVLARKQKAPQPPDANDSSGAFPAGTPSR